MSNDNVITYNINQSKTQADIYIKKYCKVITS